MRLKFKTLAYETNAIESVVDCFDGQPISSIWPFAGMSRVAPTPNRATRTKRSLMSRINYSPATLICQFDYHGSTATRRATRFERKFNTYKPVSLFYV